MVALIFLGTISAQKKLKKSLDVSKITMVDPDQLAQGDINRILASGPVKLNPYFKADDGSVVCLRQIEDKVYGIADRMDRRFSSIWVGNIEGRTLKLSYFFIPKGQAKGSGTVEFAVSGAGVGQRLTLKTSLKNQLKGTPLNIKSLNGMGKLQGRLPINDRAWYRGNALNNLTGRWKIDNVGQDYVLDMGNQVIVYSVGGRVNANARPQFTSLFIGDRTGNDLKGFYVDLPLGRTIGFGKAVFKIIGPHFIRAGYDHFYYGVDRKRITEDKREVLQ